MENIRNRTLMTHTGLWIALVTTVIFTSANLQLAPLNQDEGWYLMAAKRVSQGKIPYLDFAYTQGPVMPLVYAMAEPWFNAQGLLGGRLFTALLGSITLLMVLMIVRREGRSSEEGFTGLCLAMALLGANAFQSQFTAVVKTYSLAGLYVVGATFMFLSARRTLRSSMIMGTALLLVLATGTRLSMAVLLPVFGFSLLLDRKRIGNRPWILFAISGIIGLLLVYGPFLCFARDQLIFGLLEFHGARAVDNLWLLKAGFLSRMIQAYFVASALLVALVITHRRTASGYDHDFPFATLWCGVAAVTLVHLIAPFPYDDYQAAIYPLAVILIAVDLSHRLPINQKGIACLLLSLVCVASSISSPVVQNWFLLRRDRIWWLTKPVSDLTLLQNTAYRIRKSSPKATTLLTPDLYLAIESGLDVPEGLEMGPFSFYPQWSTETAKRRRVLNLDLLESVLIHSDAPIAATSGYAFQIQNPNITPVSPEVANWVRRNFRRYYQEWFTVESFGQGYTTLQLWQRRPDLTLSME